MSEYEHAKKLASVVLDDTDRDPDDDLSTLARQFERARESVDSAYSDRNRLVALLACLYPSGLKRTAIEGWDPEWHNCVYINLPTGQVSFHYHDGDADLFSYLPPYQDSWDGHTTIQKWFRIGQLAGTAWQNLNLRK